MKTLDIKLTQEMLQSLFEGKRLEQNWYQPGGETLRIVIYPDRYGVFMTHEKMAEIKRNLRHNIEMEVMEKLFDEPEAITIKDSN